MALGDGTAAGSIGYS